MSIVVEHFEKGVRSFENDEDFIKFVQKIWVENGEQEEGVLEPIKTKQAALTYITAYCDNFKIKD